MGGHLYLTLNRISFHLNNVFIEKNVVQHLILVSINGILCHWNWCPRCPWSEQKVEVNMWKEEYHSIWTYNWWNDSNDASVIKDASITNNDNFNQIHVFYWFRQSDNEINTRFCREAITTETEEEQERVRATANISEEAKESQKEE